MLRAVSILSGDAQTYCYQVLFCPIHINSAPQRFFWRITWLDTSGALGQDETENTDVEEEDRHFSVYRTVCCWALHSKENKRRTWLKMVAKSHPKQEWLKKENRIDCIYGWDWKEAPYFFRWIVSIILESAVFWVALFHISLCDSNGWIS